MRCDPQHSVPAVCCHGSSTMMDAPSGTLRWNKPFLPQVSFRCGVFNSSRKEKQKYPSWGGVRMRTAMLGKCFEGEENAGAGWLFITGQKSTCLFLSPSFTLPVSFLFPFFFHSKANNFLIALSLWLFSILLIRFIFVERAGMLGTPAGKWCATVKVMGEGGRKLWPDYTICMCTNITMKDGKYCRETRFS